MRVLLEAADLVQKTEEKLLFDVSRHKIINTDEKNSVAILIMRFKNVNTQHQNLRNKSINQLLKISCILPDLNLA